MKSEKKQNIPKDLTHLSQQFMMIKIRHTIYELTSLIPKSEVAYIQLCALLDKLLGPEYWKGDIEKVYRYIIESREKNTLTLADLRNYLRFFTKNHQ